MVVQGVRTNVPKNPGYVLVCYGYFILRLLYEQYNIENNVHFIVVKCAFALLRLRFRTGSHLVCFLDCPIFEILMACHRYESLEMEILTVPRPAPEYSM